MKITELRVFVAVNDLGGKVWNPKIRWQKKYSIIVEVLTDAGIAGVGECWCFDQAPDALVAFLATEVTPRVRGMDATDIGEVARVLLDTTTLSARHGIMASALSGIDIALWDIAAKARGEPLYRLLGGTRGEVPVYASGGLYAPDKTADRLAAELEGYIRQGFAAAKLKVGALAPRADEKRVKHVRRLLGETPGLIIDGVYSFDAARAAAFYSRVADAGISAFQSPVPADDIAAMSELVARHSVPVMALEAEYRPLVFRQLVERRAVAVLQFALVACGGITAGRDLVRLASAAGLPCSLEVSSTAVAQMAAFHFAAANPEVVSVEYHMVHQVLFDRLPFPASAIRDGRLRLPDVRGLGIELPADLLERRA